MKELMFVIFTLLLSNPFFAQTSKGDQLIGGTGNVGVTFIENSDNVFALNLNPNYGVFLQDNLALGGILGLGYSKQGDLSSTQLNLAPFARYYFTEPETTQFYAQASAGLFLSAFDSSFGDNSDTAFLVEVGPGMAFYLADYVSLDFLLAYRYIGGDFDIGTFGVNIGFQIYLSGDGEKD